MGKTFKKIARKFALKKDELEILSKFLIDVAKGILGVPIIVYFVTGFSLLALTMAFMLDSVVVVICFGAAIKLRRVAKRKLI